MDLEQLSGLIPEYAKDLRLNLGSVLRQPELSQRQTWGTALACAMACRNARLLEAVELEASKYLDHTAMAAAKTAAALMGMNNVFYRFKHFAGEKYAAVPARLRMQPIRTHGADALDFELWCLAVSAVNGCAACVNSHEQVVREKGLSEESVVAAVRIAAVLHGVAAVV
jgi:lipoyl-dependent peroxiredoxin subunit D